MQTFWPIPNHPQPLKTSQLPWAAVRSHRPLPQCRLPETEPGSEWRLGRCWCASNRRQTLGLAKNWANMALSIFNQSRATIHYTLTQQSLDIFGCSTCFSPSSSPRSTKSLPPFVSRAAVDCRTVAAIRGRRGGKPRLGPSPCGRGAGRRRGSLKWRWALGKFGSNIFLKPWCFATPGKDMVIWHGKTYGCRKNDVGKHHFSVKP